MAVRFTHVVLSCAVAVAVAGCGSSDAEPGSAATPQGVPTTTAAAPTTSTTVPAPSGLVSFDGTSCSYEGPTEVSIAEQFTLDVANTSEFGLWAQLVWAKENERDEMVALVGTDFDYAAHDYRPPTAFVDVGANAETSSGVFLPAPGTYVVDCLSLDGAEPQYVWRLAAIEFVP